MIWHEMVCDKCAKVLVGFAGTNSYNKTLKKHAKAAGWLVKRDGTAICKECSGERN